MNKTLTPKFGFVFFLVLAAAMSRLIPHWPNLTPIAAIALFGAARFSNKIIAFIVPMIALFISDLVLGLHEMMPAVYIAFILTGIIGLSLRSTNKVLPIGMAAIGSTILFFLITNFASWLAMPLYPKNVVGLMEAYTAGLAFFNDGNVGISMFANSLIGDLMFTSILFGAYALAEKKIPALVRA